MRGLLNDARHAQLSKGTRLAQVHVDDVANGAGRAAYGACTVQEIHARTALTDFTMGGHARGVAWSLNPYVGCVHGCRYCFVPQTLHGERRRWGRYVLAKRNLPNVLRGEVRTRPAKTVFVSTATDPYQAAEADQRVTQGCLRVLAHVDWPVDVLTRSPLVLRDVGLLGRFSQVRVGLSVPTLDDDARRVIEPTAPPIPARLRALRALADAGLTVYANLSPAYPPTGGTTMEDVAEAFLQAGVKWVNTSAWKYPSGYLGPLWDGLGRTGWADFARYVGDPVRQVEQGRRLRRAMKRVGIPLRYGFFNPPMDVAKAPAGADAGRPLERFCAGPDPAPAASG